MTFLETLSLIDASLSVLALAVNFFGGFLGAIFSWSHSPIFNEHLQSTPSSNAFDQDLIHCLACLLVTSREASELIGMPEDLELCTE